MPKLIRATVQFEVHLESAISDEEWEAYENATNHLVSFKASEAIEQGLHNEDINIQSVSDITEEEAQEYDDYE